MKKYFFIFTVLLLIGLIGCNTEKEIVEEKLVVKEVKEELKVEEKSEPKIDLSGCKDITVVDQIWKGCNEIKGINIIKDKDSNGRVYGDFYNWEEVENACSDGYHVPSKQEWQAANSNLMRELKSDWSLTSVNEVLKLPVYDAYENDPETYSDGKKRGFYWTSDYQFFQEIIENGRKAGGSLIGEYDNSELKIRCIKD